MPTTLDLTKYLYTIDISKDFFTLRELIGREEIIKKGILGFAIPDSKEIIDVHTPVLSKDVKSIIIYTWEDDEGKEVYWHSSAHILADAILQIFPEAKITIGPPIDNGFYYDIDFGTAQMTPDFIPLVENKINEIISKNYSFERIEVNERDAKDFYEKKYPNPYKLEILNDIINKKQKITFYRHGDFWDLCSGPHVLDVTFLKFFKITGLSAAYWKGNSKNPQLTRIYGISFPTKVELDNYLLKLQEAEKRDHKVIGREMELFIISQEVGAGLPLWLPDGFIIKNTLIELIRNAQNKLGYLEVTTPHIGSRRLYEISGHYQKYAQNCYKPILTPDEHEEYLLKPMNCPHHCEIFAFKRRSYKELPLKLSEFGTVYRYEKSGEIHGLIRARGFTQDDAHIFCKEEDLETVITEIIDLIYFLIKLFNFEDIKVRISLHDPSKKEMYLGTPELWEKAEKILRKIAQKCLYNYTEEKGESAFYGPKLDFIIKDALSRKWQLSTIQLDFNLPERFNLKYMDKDNTWKKPILVHRALLGSLERFIALLIEHTGGNLPLWLSPVQVAILPVNESTCKYSENLCEELKNNKIRAIISFPQERLAKRIKQMEIRRVPIQAIVGEKEINNNTVNVRSRIPSFIKNNYEYSREEFINLIVKYSKLPDFK